MLTEAQIAAISGCFLGLLSGGLAGAAFKKPGAGNKLFGVFIVATAFVAAWHYGTFD